MSIFKCKMCGGTLEITNETVATCEYCGTQQTLPKLDSDRKTNLYDRANHFRRNNEFDKAMGIYEQILSEDGSDAEAYWSLVLCRYGIEYVEDPATHKRLPTVNRAQFTSVFDDDNYRSALQYADASQRTLYEAEANQINEIQKGILAISQKEEPFDVFICYKESDQSGRRTPDSVLAQELYYQLHQEGFKVFFSRITLEDKLGSAYEPYIFAALNSARVMVVLGTRPEYFKAVWVKNEWSRYLSLIKSGAKKMLIPAYKDMDPYDLPEEFSHLQAQDMSRLGFMQDLIRGIKKITAVEEPRPVISQSIPVPAVTNTTPLLRRAFMFLEDREWNSANEYSEKVLDIDPECAEAYLAKLMAELRVTTRENLAQYAEPFDNKPNFQKVIRFGDDALVEELRRCNTTIRQRNELNRLNRIYTNAENAMLPGTEQGFLKAAELFSQIPGHKDAAKMAELCLEKAEIARLDAIYDQAAKKMASGATQADYKNAAEIFSRIPNHRDSAARAAECLDLAEQVRKNAIYISAKNKIVTNRIEEYKAARDEMLTILDWKDARELSEQWSVRIQELEQERETRLRKAKERLEQQRLEEKARNKRSVIILIIIALAVVAIIVGYLLVNQYVLLPNAYDAADQLYQSGQYSEAITAFHKLNGYKDSAQRIQDARNMISEEKYQYVMSHLDIDDATTYDYLVELKRENYKNSLQLFDVLYGWEVSVVMNHSTQDTTRHLNTAEDGKDIYVHILVEGGEPGEQVTLTVTMEASDNYKETITLYAERGEEGLTVTPGVNCKWVKVTIENEAEGIYVTRKIQVP